MKLTQRMLAERMAKEHNIDRETAEQFLSEFFGAVSASLVSSSTVKIKGLGTFERIAKVDGATVSFSPAPDLADKINSPFSFFEPVVLNESVTEEMLDAIDNAPETDETDSDSVEPQTEQTTNEVTTEESPQVHEIPPAEVTETVETADSSAVKNYVAAEEEPTVEPAVNICPPETVAETIEDSDSTEYETSDYPAGETRRRNPWVIIIALVSGLVAGFFSGYYYNDIISDSADEESQSVKEVTTEENREDAPIESKEIAPDTVDKEIVPTEEAPSATAGTAVVTDTVRAAYYYTHMAKKYYGNKHFWSYIYEENKDKLGHPEQVKPGTVVVIPPAEKYGIDAGNPESVKAAKKLGYEIYGRFSR